MKRIALTMAGMLVLLVGCGSAGGSDYPVRISHARALELMADEDVVIVDVRTAAEFAGGHIDGALLLPADEIDTRAGEVLPDTGRVVLVYCQSGNRSRNASLKLVSLGYSRVYDFGGIAGWPGSIVR